MDKLDIKKTKVSPSITADPETGKVEIIGESYPENAVSFYRPLINWLNEAVESKKEIQLNFRLDYFNTSSSKCILDMLTILEKHHAEGGKVKVFWYYAEDDEDMQEAGEDFLSDFNLPFEIKVNE